MIRPIWLGSSRKQTNSAGIKLHQNRKNFSAQLRTNFLDNTDNSAYSRIKSYSHLILDSLCLDIAWVGLQYMIVRIVLVQRYEPLLINEIAMINFTCFTFRLNQIRKALNNLTHRLNGPASVVQGALPELLTKVPQNFFHKIMSHIQVRWRFHLTGLLMMIDAWLRSIS